MSWDDMNKNHMAWPSVGEVTEYRRKVFNVIKNLILEHPAFETLGRDLDKYVEVIYHYGTGSCCEKQEELICGML